MITSFVRIFIYLFSLTVYLTTLAPNIYWGDSAEFATTSVLLDIAHPPSYPLYNILGKLFSFLPAGDLAFRINFASSYFAAFTVILLFLIVSFLILSLNKTLKIIVSIFSSVIFTVSSTFWHHSIKAEVYTLYVFLFALIIFILLLYNERNDIRYSYLAGLVFCFSLTNHLLIILSFVPFLFFILTHNYKILLNKRNFIILFLFSAMAFSIYLYLPLRSAKETKINWGRPQTIEDFKYIILLKEQGKLHFETPQQEDITKKNITEIKRAMKKDYFPRLSFQFITYFIILLPLYFSFLLVYKKEHQISTTTKLFIFLFYLIFYSYLVLSYYISIPPEIRKVAISQMIQEIIIEIVFCITFFILTLYFTYLSFTSKHREIVRKWVIFLASLITLLTYAYFPKLSKPYQASDVSFLIYLDIFIKQFSIYLFPLGILGLIKLYSENLRVFAFLFFLFIASGPLPILLIMPDNIPLFQERFSLPAYFIYSIFVGFGIKAVMDFFQKYTKLNYKYFYPLLIFSLIPLFLNFKEADKSKYYFTKNYVDDIFLTLPKNSIVFAKGIDTVFPLWYFSFVEKKRSDVTIVYIDALALKWYIDNLRKNTNLTMNELEKKISSEIQRRTLYIENIIKNNIEKYPIYYGGVPLFIPAGIKEKTIIPEGILFKIIKIPRDTITKDEIKKNEQLLKSYKFTKSLSGIDYSAKDIVSIYAGGYFKLAVSYLSQEKHNEALKELNKAIKIDKSFAPSYSALSQIYLQEGDVRKAEKILKEGVKNNPKEIDLIFQLAYLNFETGNINESIKLIDKIIKLQPEFIPAYLAKVEVLITIGEKKKTKEVLNEIQKIDPTNQTALDTLKQLR